LNVEKGVKKASFTETIHPQLRPESAAPINAMNLWRFRSSLASLFFYIFHSYTFGYQFTYVKVGNPRNLGSFRSMVSGTQLRLLGGGAAPAVAKFLPDEAELFAYIIISGVEKGPEEAPHDLRGGGSLSDASVARPCTGRDKFVCDDTKYIAEAKAASRTEDFVFCLGEYFNMSKIWYPV
jgi:hypothetical protein